MNTANTCALLGVIVALAALGCDQPRRLTNPERLNLDERFGTSSDPLPTQAPAASSRPGEVWAGKRNWISSDSLPWETWYLQYLDAKLIGYSHLLVQQTPSNNDGLRIAIQRTDVVELNNADERSVIQRRIESIEYADGRLISITDSLQAEGTTELTEGDFPTENQLRLKKSGEQRIVNWEAGVWGLAGVQAIFLQRPLQPAEERTAKVYVPQLSQVAQVSMVAAQPESTTLPDGTSASLLPVQVQMQVDGNNLSTRNWINDRGEIMKTVSLSGPSISTFRVSPGIAQRARDALRLHDLQDQSIALTSYPDPPPTQTAVYALMLKLGTDAPLLDVNTLFTDGSHQTVRFPVALGAEVTVQQDPLEVPQPTDEELSDYLTSSPIIVADAPEIAQLVEKILAAASQPTEELVPEDNQRELALELTQGVFESLQPLAFAGEFPNAVQVAQSSTGDCTGHAALLAAVLRHKEIPARVASGFRVDPEDTRRMIFHMWTEAWVDQTWLALDAMQGGIAAVDRVKVMHSPLSGENPYTAVLPVLEIMGNFEATYER